MLLSPLVRMAPLQLGEVPDHPLFHKFETSDAKRPELLPFLLALLDHGNAFIENKNFNLKFTSHSHKSAPPSNTDVEVLTHSVSASDLAEVNWKDTGIPGFQRSRPRQNEPEHWFARRSLHKNISVKKNPSTASWDEFVYGLRDEHSKHEYDFTPTLYDAHHMLDWNEEIGKGTQGWKLDQRQVENPALPSYSNITMSIYEMCHAIPWPLQPRCFAVLVATASTSSNRFIAVTVPVNLDNFGGAFYSTGRNQIEGEDRQQKKSVVIGQYTAVEQVQMYEQDVAGGTEGEKEEIIEWVMATASDARGNLPMSVQRTSLPGQVPKDVSFFLSWIKNVDEQDVKLQKTGTHTASRILSSVRRSISDAAVGPPVLAP